jgi:hypothetical protein
LVSNGPKIDPERVGVQYQPDGRLSTFPKNTATFTGKGTYGRLLNEILQAEILANEAQAKLIQRFLCQLKKDL